MIFRVGSHLDMEMVSGLLANEGDQFIGIAKLACLDHTGRHVTAQCHDMVDVLILVAGQHLTDIFTGRADTGQVRCSVDTGFFLKINDSLESTVPC